jgi:N-acetylglucosaminyldiphosphoundecaprenol N-acetyl-beta-D-mannosaminyltransferase
LLEIHINSPLNDWVQVLGVNINNLSQAEAIGLMESWMRDRDSTRSIFIVNAHTLNLASDDPHFQSVLRHANRVFADGTGVRWAARLRGVRLKENLVGTDLIPRLFADTAGRGYRYFLLGANAKTINLAAHRCEADFRGWDLAGFHHGYISEAETASVIEKINGARADVLLVGMGNPMQECWIHRYQQQLRVPVCIGVGGLFDHWAGNLQRAPDWVRRQGFEWLQLLIQQPHKWRRYLLGNPKFLMRIIRNLSKDLARSTQF